jgi:serine/threonine protein phosphatase PrpC
MIKITHQEYISQTGKRNNNEDNFGLNKGFSFVVCDGVGGAEKGEIASEIVVRSFVDEYRENENADANEVLKNTENKLTKYINENPDALGMATTLTFSQVRANGIYIAWVGDSRIYQFRNGSIVFKTTDHSWVNEALKSGIINAAEAVNHPKSNIITRAVQGSHKPTIADTKLLTDIQKGDLFLHCSDGVLESWDDDSLCALFTSKSDPKIIIELINKECNKNSKDNYTAIVYKIEEAVIHERQPNIHQTTTYIDAIPLDRNEFIAKKSNASVRGVLKVKIMGLPLIFWFILFIPVVFYFTISKNKKQITQPLTTIGTKQQPTTKLNSETPEKLKPTNKLLDSLKNSGWTKSRQTKPTELTTLEDNLDSLSKQTEKLKLKKDKNISDSNEITQNNKKITECKEKIKKWHYDSQKVENVYYYDKEWKKN